MGLFVMIAQIFATVFSFMLLAAVSYLFLVEGEPIISDDFGIPYWGGSGFSKTVEKFYNVGAGDAFCAGSLYGLYNGFSDKEILEFASAAAACNLFAENSIDGMKSKSEIYKIADEYGRLSI